MNKDSESNKKTVIYNRLSREELLALSMRDEDKRTKYDCFETLLRFKNFSGASEAAAHLKYSNISGLGKNKIIRAYLSSSLGAQANFLIKNYISCFLDDGVSEKELILFLDNLHKSGLNRSEKYEIISKIKRTTSLGDSGKELLACTEFLIAYDDNNSVKPNCFIQDFTDLKNPLVVEKLVSYFYSMGEEKLAFRLLDQLAEMRGTFDDKVLRLSSLYRPEWLEEKIKHESNVLDIAEKSHLLVFSELRKKSEFFKEFYQVNLEKSINKYSGLNNYEKDGFIYTMLHIEEFERAIDLVGEEIYPNTMLSIQALRGYRCLLEEKFNESKDLFMGVLKQNPADLVSSQGIRFSLPRTGESMSSLIGLRQTIGYGIKGSGETGKHNVWGDLTISLLMSGSYLSGLYSKRKASHWVSLKCNYGDKFLCFEKLPEKKQGSLFIIADEGVGDEVRTAQFYREISKKYETVIATCDPRLYGVFKKSFPDINFLPVPRFRKGVREQESGMPQRLHGFSPKIANYLSAECQEIIDSSDFLTFGQTLFFNKFAGVLGAPEENNYLVPTGDYKITCTNKRRVGILWRSHLRTSWRRFMYMELEDFAPLAKLDNIELWAVQHEMTHDEVEFCRNNGILVSENIDMFNDFDAMSGFISQMDLLVGISSAPIELGAALGVPVWMLGISPENYYLRTAGGTTHVDQLTVNSKIIAPSWIDFSEPRELCRDMVIKEVVTALSP